MFPNRQSLLFWALALATVIGLIYAANAPYVCVIGPHGPDRIGK